MPLPLLAGIGAYNDTKCLVTSTNDAVEALKHTLESLNKDEKLVIYADGPATNVSTLLLLYPQLSKKIDFVLLFMGRDTVTHPKFAVGTTNTLFDLYFSDFNFDLDGYAVEVLIKSHISLVFVGGEVANQSMWLNRNDIAKIVFELFTVAFSKLITMPRSVVFIYYSQGIVNEMDVQFDCPFRCPFRCPSCTV